MMKEFLKLSVLLIRPLKTIIARGCQWWSNNSISDALTWQFISVVKMSLNKLLLSSWRLSTMRPNIWTLKMCFFFIFAHYFSSGSRLSSLWRTSALSASAPRPTTIHVLIRFLHPHTPLEKPSRKAKITLFQEGCCYDWSMLDAYSTSLYLQVWHEFLKFRFHDCGAHEPTPTAV